MKYKTEDLEKMTKEELLNTYKKANTSVKKDILKALANSWKFAILMKSLDYNDLKQMAKIHPYKEVVADAIIDEFEARGELKNPNNLDSILILLEQKSFLDKLKEFITRKPALPDTLYQKVAKARYMCSLQEKINNANGKKMEELETQDLDKAVDESRVEVNTGEMAKIFDRHARKEVMKYDYNVIGSKFEKFEQEMIPKLTEEYISVLGEDKKDIAELVANAEFENNSGKDKYVPYSSR